MKVTIVEATQSPEEVVCTAARNDYMTEWVGDKSFSEIMESVDGDNLRQKMEHLIHDLLGKGHYGPFEHPQVTFTVEGVSRVCMAQLTRHRHASFDVQSMRYTNPSPDDLEDMESIEEMEGYVAVPELVWELDDDGYLIDGQRPVERYLENCKDQFLEYASWLEAADAAGIPRKRAKQDARFVLPLGTKVNMTFSVNLRMLLHIGDMRAAGDAQWEIRELTNNILDLASHWAPITMEYYMEEMKDRRNRLAP